MAAHRCRSWGRRGACVLLEMCQSSHRTGKEKAPGFSLPPTFQSPAPDSPLAKPTPEGRCSGSLRSCLLQGQCRAEQRAGMGSAKGREAFHRMRADSLVCVLVAQLCLTLAAPGTAAHQAPLSVGFSRQEYCSGLPFPSW